MINNYGYNIVYPQYLATGAQAVKPPTFKSLFLDFVKKKKKEEIEKFNVYEQRLYEEYNK